MGNHKKDAHMKTKAAVVLASFLTVGCATSGGFGQFLQEMTVGALTGSSPPRRAWASQEEISRMADLAWPIYLEGSSIMAACDDARSQMGMGLKFGSKERDLQQCTENLAIRLSKQAEKERIALIRENKAEILTISEAAAVFDAANGQSLAHSPMLQPDNRKYTFSGFIDQGEGLHPDRFLMRTSNYRDHAYAYVEIDNRSTKMPPTARADSELFIVGNYVGNMPYTTIRKTGRVMPVFKAVFVKVVD